MGRGGRFTGGAIALLLALVLAPASGAAPSGQVMAGVGKVDATWHVGASAGQYASEDTPVGDHGVNPSLEDTRRAPSYGAQSHLDVRAIVIQGGDGKRIALVKNDLYIPQDMLWRRTAQLLEAYDAAHPDAPTRVGHANLTMLASHDHSSPYYSSWDWGVWAFQDVIDPRFFEYYAERQALAVEQAAQHLVPVRVGAAVSQFDKTHKHSYGPAIADDGTPAGYPQSETDHDLVVVRFDDISDPGHPKPLAILSNWGLHGEGLNGNNLISGDWIVPTERMVDRATGAMYFFTQNAVGTSEMERSTYHSTHERLEFNHREYGQGEYAARLLTNAIVGTWKDIDHGTPPDRDRYVPYMTRFPVQEDNQWFPGPLSHPYPGVSSCRTDAALGGDPRLPVVGLPDCQSLRDFGFPDLALGLSTDTFEQYGIPVPENYSAPSYTGLEEDVDVHLQAFRLGDILFTACSCEQWKDQAQNIKTRTDVRPNNEWLGYDWYQQCTKQGDGTWTCPNPGGGAPLTKLPDHNVQRMHAEVVNPANGWNDPSYVHQAESEPTDTSKIKGNFTHDDTPAMARYGYRITATMAMANDYNGYIASYREYQRGDHYRKALTGWGAHSSDYMATHLVQMGRRLNGAPVDPWDDSDKLMQGKPVLDNAFNDARVSALGQFGIADTQAWDAMLPDDGGTAKAVDQPRDIERFAPTFFRWVGGDNYTDQPQVRVQRLVDGQWRDFADQTGEVPVTLALPKQSDATKLDPSGFVPTWLSDSYQWVWTAHFEAFASNFDTGAGEIATPSGEYRFTVDGMRRQGRKAVPYHLDSSTFRVSPWSGITVDSLTRGADGKVSFDVGPRHTVKAYDLGVSEHLRDDVTTKNPDLMKTGVDVPLGPIDYPDTYPNDAYAKSHRADFVFDVKSYRRDPAAPNDVSRFELFCFTCSFRPWADTGDATRATVTVVRADGSTERVAASESPPGSGHFVADRSLTAGETPVVLAGDVCDVFGDSNGAIATPAGLSVPVALPVHGAGCGEPAPDPGTIISPEPLATGSVHGGLSEPAPPAFAAGQRPFGSTVQSVRQAAPCLAPRGGIDGRRIGLVRIGDRLADVRRRLGRAGTAQGGSVAWCVRGGGTISAAFSRGRAVAVATTAPGYQGARGAGPGDSLSRARKAYPGARSARGGFTVQSHSTRLLFVGARSRVAYVALADARLGRAALLRYLRAAGVAR